MSEVRVHWLYGKDKRLHPLDQETPCQECIHAKVCDRNVEKRCANFRFGTSAERGCGACLHKYTRWDKEEWPCFVCPDFRRKEDIVNDTIPTILMNGAEVSLDGLKYRREVDT